MAYRINKNWIVLIAALCVGGLAALGAKNYLGAQMAEIEAREKNKATVQVVVAKADLGKGGVLSAENVAVRPLPKEWAHSGAITPDQFGRAEGAVLAYPANSGEPLIWSQLEGQRTPTFSARLTQGRRAVTVPVDEISSLSGMVEPGDLIDIVVSLKKDSKNFTLTLLQSVTVLATGTKASPDDQDPGGAAPLPPLRWTPRPRMQNASLPHARSGGSPRSCVHPTTPAAYRGIAPMH
jgi:pilus assembly protein CpaB